MIKHLAVALLCLSATQLGANAAPTSAGNGGGNPKLAEATPPPPATPATKTKKEKILFYRSPMHPHVTSSKPGKCTVCGMELVPVFEDESPSPPAGTTVVKLGAATESVIGIATSEIRVAPLRRTLRVAGVMADDETRHRVLAARVPGRIEKLFINQVGAEVVSGQPLADIYSPDVLTAQRLYLEKLRAGSGVIPASEITSSREKLLALGLTEPDIRLIETEKKTNPNLTLRAPFAGTVVSRNAYEGQYVNPNDSLFEIGDFSTLWFIFDAYERDLASLAINQQVTVMLPSFPGEPVTAPITFIDPNLNETTRTARIRVVIPNPQRRILNRQTALGVVHIETAPVLLVPRSAILYTREQPVAYVAIGKGQYQMRSLRLGKIGDTDAEVLDGLAPREQVVTQAALLVDSQAQLTQISTPTPTPAQPHPPTATHPPTPTPAEVAPLPAALVRAALAATAALANDDLAAYQHALPSLKKAVAETTGTAAAALAPLAEKLVPGPDLKTVRQPFEAFSSGLADIVRAMPAENRPAKIFQCRMTPVLGTSRWLQADNTAILNPFFGHAMLHCGDELK